MIVHDEAREADIQRLAEAVLYISPDYWDNPNGGYETTCPFCRVKESRGGGGDIWAYMRELDHKPDCAYLIAKDLSTKRGKQAIVEQRNRIDNAADKEKLF